VIERENGSPSPLPPYPGYGGQVAAMADSLRLSPRLPAVAHSRGEQAEDERRLASPNGLSPYFLTARLAA
jgi:hypothetical protein